LNTRLGVARSSTLTLTLALALLWIGSGCGGSIAPGSSPADGGSRDGATDASADGTRPGQDGALDGTIGPDAPDATVGDGEADGSMGVDANEGDTAVPCNGGQCPSPASVVGFQPTWIPPTGAHQGVCTTALITEFYSDCLAAGGACTMFNGGDPAHQACAKCLQSQYSDPAWGPLVYGTDNIVETNLAGCIDLLQPSAQPCALSLEAEDECEHAACDPVCNAASDPNFDQWVTCSSAANTCGCESWFQAATCVKGLAADAGPGAQCLVGQTFQDYYYVVAPLFCGD
jgi:hypothetical protein